MHHGANPVANDAINPVQQFRTFTGLPNANGQIEFFTDSGRGTPKLIFSDEALTVAQSNPYTLDDSGRIGPDGEGEVHYEGTATLVHTDRTGFEFRQDDDVVVTSDGNVAQITIQEGSVASMIANVALVLGNIVATRGYYSQNLFGGARYVIVAAGTGTVDSYLYHNLGNGLQAELLDLERNVTFLVAGARGDSGSDDTVAMQAVINRGGDIKVEGGFTFVATNLQITKNVRFIGSGAIKQRNGAAGDLFQITSIAVTAVAFRDVILDGNQPNVDENNSTVGWVIS